MPSSLVLTADPETTSIIDNAAKKYGISLRSVSSTHAAEEWLGMHSFDLLLLDSQFEIESETELLDLGWQKNPLMIGAVFNLKGSVTNPWAAKYRGARVFSGPDSLSHIEQAFYNLKEYVKESGEKAVLLVEDLESPRFIISSFIEALGLGPVDCCANAADALATLEVAMDGYYCILTDLNMPEMSGLELIGKVRTQPTLQHLPVIVLTSYATSENLIDCLRAGATGFLVKPPQKTALRKELEKAKRIFLSNQSPRLCAPDEAHSLEEHLSSIKLS